MESKKNKLKYWWKRIISYIDKKIACNILNFFCIFITTVEGRSILTGIALLILLTMIFSNYYGIELSIVIK